MNKYIYLVTMNKFILQYMYFCFGSEELCCGRAVLEYFRHTCEVASLYVKIRYLSSEHNGKTHSRDLCNNLSEHVRHCTVNSMKIDVDYVD